MEHPQITSSFISPYKKLKMAIQQHGWNMFPTLNISLASPSLRKFFQASLRIFAQIGPAKFSRANFGGFVLQGTPGHHELCRCRS